MKVSRVSSVVCACLLALSVTASQAALVSRLGGQVYYDTELDITWLANANLANSSAFGTAGINANGTMTWNTANTWISNLNADAGTGYLGFNDWRLPTLSPINSVNFNTTTSFDGSADFGTNVTRPGTLYGGSTASEFAHLFYNTLGNVSEFDVSGTFVNSCLGSCLVNTGPFSFIQDSGGYWAVESESVTTDAWRFVFVNGIQDAISKDSVGYVWAVRDGDVIAATPIPAAFWLFSSAVLGLIGATRRKI